jgi:hypothetical protein
VLDGVYRLKVAGHQGQWESSADRLGRMLQVDVDGWPKQIEIKGGLVQLPPVRLRLAQEIQLTAPESGSSVDLRKAELTWIPLPDADHYKLQLCYTAETPTPTQFYFLFPTTKEPRLRFTELPEFERKQLQTNYLPGRTGGWRVEAYDAAGKRIGISLDEDRFLIANGLDAGP